MIERAANGKMAVIAVARNTWQPAALPNSNPHVAVDSPLPSFDC
jgi:hypothetical protein